MKLETQFGVSLEADFQENTWTFKMPDPYTIMAGEFAILQKEVYDEMVKEIESLKNQIK